MKTKANQFQPVSRTIPSKTEAARQAPAKQILQRYQSKTVQRQDLDEEELLQGKFQDTAQRMELDELDEEVPLQTKESDEVSWRGSPDPYQDLTQNNTGLPDNLKTGIESLSGFSMDDVRVHYNSGKPTQLQALAYTQGTDIHVAPGQEKHVPHEVWHVVQQKQGRVQPTMQLQGVNINDNEGLEKEADVMGGKAIQNKSIIQCRTITGAIYNTKKHHIRLEGKSNPVNIPLQNLTYSPNNYPLINRTTLPPGLMRGHLIKAAWDGGNDPDRISQWGQNREDEWAEFEKNRRNCCKDAGMYGWVSGEN